MYDEAQKRTLQDPTEIHEAVESAVADQLSRDEKTKIVEWLEKFGREATRDNVMMAEMVPTTATESHTTPKIGEPT